MSFLGIGDKRVPISVTLRSKAVEVKDSFNRMNINHNCGLNGCKLFIGNWEDKQDDVRFNIEGSKCGKKSIIGLDTLMVLADNSKLENKLKDLEKNANK